MRVMGREYGAVFRRKVYNLYNRLPYKARRVFSAAARMVPSEYILGREFRVTNHELGSMEALSLEELRSAQLQRLVSILVHALDTTEYYREAFRNQGISKNDVLDRPLDALLQLPLVDKALIRERYHEFVSSDKDSM
jgi:phenylacetate-coenzyme A ligase PaaK-like adenylate-forming protein